MDMGRMTPFEKIKTCIEGNNSFVLQGGAGSGKTETLKQTLEYISTNYPDRKIACITHTNLAVDEIKSRVGTQYTVSTIHSFLNDFIKNYKRNMHKVIVELFRLDVMVRKEVNEYGGNETNKKKEEHNRYKKIHTKYSSFLFRVKKERFEKVEGKREYDKNPDDFNAALNEKITQLNDEVLQQIQNHDFNTIKYNETSFNNFHDLTFGHDDLLTMSSLLFDRYPILGKILQDKFDCIFIDEYQDTNKKVIDIFLNKTPNPDKMIVGLFGDSMQAIYEDGVGDVETYINNGALIKINKEDNYRCSEQVKDFINKLRTDGLVQNIALKTKTDGTLETMEERQGSVTLYYCVYGSKPNSRNPEEKKKYLEILEALVAKSSEGQSGFKHLKLTNKSIAHDAGFGNLFEIFSSRFSDQNESLEKHLTGLQFTDLYELCTAFKPTDKSAPNYNFVLSKLKQIGFSIKKIADKKMVKEKFDAILNSQQGALETLNLAFESELLKKSDSYFGYLEKRDKFISDLCENAQFEGFKNLYLEGKNTLKRISGDLPTLDQYEFDELQRNLKIETFYSNLFSEELSFREIISYFDYINEKKDYITMHKTKGSGIEDVIVVLDEYFWSTDYNFRSAFSEEQSHQNRKHKTKKLVYVACSRAISNLKCVRLLENEEEENDMKRYFDQCVKIEYQDLAS